MNDEMTEILSDLRTAADAFAAPLERLQTKVGEAVDAAEAWLAKKPYYPSERFGALRGHESFGLDMSISFGLNEIDILRGSTDEDFTVTLTHRDENDYETGVHLTMSEVENIIPALERDYAPVAAAIKKRKIAELKAKERELEETLAAVRASIEEEGTS